MFSWGNALFTLKIEGTLLFEPGINLITGPTGSGKTSLLMALLGYWVSCTACKEAEISNYRWNEIPENDPCVMVQPSSSAGSCFGATRVLDSKRHNQSQLKCSNLSWRLTFFFRITLFSPARSTKIDTTKVSVRTSVASLFCLSILSCGHCTLIWHHTGSKKQATQLL